MSEVAEVSKRELREGLRRRVWEAMERLGVAAFPRPVYGRIPNFVGAEEAARRLADLPLFRRARVVKVNPDAPQRPVRELVLTQGKLLIMPSPRISKGFLLLDPSRMPQHLYHQASTIGGAFRWGRIVEPEELPGVDLIVAGSVVVSVHGERLGKGEGYSELEYAILREVNRVTEDVPIVTTVHDVQVVDFHIPLEPWDVTVDYVVTPTRTLACASEKRRPKGILWDLLDPSKLEEVPLLKRLLRKRSIG